jgi:hypothetical protein
MALLALRSSLLQAGDVILMRSAGWQGTAIAWLSGGAYSHAALFLGGTFTFESDGEDVVGLRRLKAVGWERTAERSDLLMRLPEGIVDACVLRHPGMASVTAENFANAYKAELFESAGKDYSRLCRLVDLAKTRFVGLRSAISRSVEYFEELHAPDAVSGAFCSELVARFLDRVGLRLFAEPRPPHQVTPNDFTTSTLTLQAGIVVDVEHSIVTKWTLESEAASVYEAVPDDFDPPESDPASWARGIHDLRLIMRAQQQLAQTLRALDNSSAALLSQTLLDLIKLWEGHINDAATVSSLLESAVTDVDRERAVRLADRYFAVLPDLERFIADTERLGKAALNVPPKTPKAFAKEGKGPPPELAEFSELMSRLQRFLAEEFAAFQDALEENLELPRPAVSG